eukprot:347947-Chlamydomonas_euryale.AAC.23
MCQKAPGEAHSCLHPPAAACPRSSGHRQGCWPSPALIAPAAPLASAAAGDGASAGLAESGGGHGGTRASDTPLIPTEAAPVPAALHGLPGSATSGAASGCVWLMPGNPPLLSGVAASIGRWLSNDGMGASVGASAAKEVGSFRA